MKIKRTERAPCKIFYADTENYDEYAERKLLEVFKKGLEIPASFSENNVSLENSEYRYGRAKKNGFYSAAKLHLLNAIRFKYNIIIEKHCK